MTFKPIWFIQTSFRKFGQDTRQNPSSITVEVVEKGFGSPLVVELEQLESQLNTPESRLLHDPPDNESLVRSSRQDA